MIEPLTKKAPTWTLLLIPLTAVVVFFLTKKNLELQAKQDETVTIQQTVEVKPLQPEDVTPVPPPEATAETQLPLTLIRTNVNADEKLNQAFIQNGKEKVKMYLQGAKIGKIARVVMINQDMVLIRNEKTGKNEIVKIAQKK